MTNRKKTKRHISPRKIVMELVDAFNDKDVDRAAALFREDAVCHQISGQTVYGREAIGKLIAEAVGRLKIEWVIENIFEDGEWAILEGRDIRGFRGCVVFRVVDSKILLQRGYWYNRSISRHYKWSFHKEIKADPGP